MAGKLKGMEGMRENLFFPLPFIHIFHSELKWKKYSGGANKKENMKLTAVLPSFHWQQSAIHFTEMWRKLLGKSWPESKASLFIFFPASFPRIRKNQKPRFSCLSQHFHSVSFVILVEVVYSIIGVSARLLFAQQIFKLLIQQTVDSRFIFSGTIRWPHVGIKK